MRIVRLMQVVTGISAITGMVMLLHTGYGYWKGQQEYRSLQERYTYTDDGESSDEDAAASSKQKSKKLKGIIDALPADAPKMMTVDFDGLKKENEDVIGWIEMPAVEISYPIMQAEDNEYYLHRDMNKEYLFAGSIFLDSKSSPTFQNLNTIVYGHNMRDGSMFAALKDYGDAETWSSCPYFWIYTPEASYLYRIGSVHQATTGSSTYIIRFPDSDFYAEWLQKMTDSSAVDTGAVWNIGDRIVTLSTCTANSGQRQVVQGAKIASVKRGEHEKTKE